MKFLIKTADGYCNIKPTDYSGKLAKFNIETVDMPDNYWNYRDNVSTIEINTIEELIELSQATNCKLIINESGIVIYDGYIE